MSIKRSEDIPADNNGTELENIVLSPSNRNRLHVGTTKGRKSEGTIYKLYRPIGILGKYLGLEPLTGLYETKRIPAIAVRPLFQFLLPMMAMLTQAFAAYEKIRLANDSSHYPSTAQMDNVIVFSLIMCRTVRCVACSFNMLVKSEKLVRLLRELDRMNPLFVVKSTSLKKITCAAFGGFLLVDIIKEIVGILILFLYQPDNKGGLDVDDLIVAIFFIGDVLFLASRFLMETTYVMLHRVLLTCLQSVNKSLADIVAVKSTDDDHPSELTREKLADIRRSYKSILEIGSQINEYFSPSLLVIFLVDTAEVCIIVFSISRMDLTKNPENIGWIALALIPLSILICFCLLADSTEMEAMNLSSILYGVHLPPDVPQPVFNEIQLLANMGNGPALTTTASGYLTINKSTLTTLMGIITTYVIIMVQFSNSEKA